MRSPRRKRSIVQLHHWDPKTVSKTLHGHHKREIKMNGKHEEKQKMKWTSVHSSEENVQN